MKELLNLGTSSPHNLIKKQILGELEENPTDQALADLIQKEQEILATGPNR